MGLFANNCCDGRIVQKFYRVAADCALKNKYYAKVCMVVHGNAWIRTGLHKLGKYCGLSDQHACTLHGKGHWGLPCSISIGIHVGTQYKLTIVARAPFWYQLEFSSRLAETYFAS